MPKSTPTRRAMLGLLTLPLTGCASLPFTGQNKMMLAGIYVDNTTTYKVDVDINLQKYGETVFNETITVDALWEDHVFGEENHEGNSVKNITRDWSSSPAVYELRVELPDYDSDWTHAQVRIPPEEWKKNGRLPPCGPGTSCIQVPEAGNNKRWPCIEAWVDVHGKAPNIDVSLHGETPNGIFSKSCGEAAEQPNSN